MIPVLTPVTGQPLVSIVRGADNFRLTCCEAFGIGGVGSHATTDGVHFAGTGNWQQNGGALYMQRIISDAPAINYDLMIEAVEDAIELTITARNKSGTPWAWPSWADFCLQMNPNLTGAPYPELYDADGSRTYIPATPARGGGMQPVASQAPDQIAASNNAHFYLPGVSAAYPPCAGCLIARSNAAGNKWVGFYFEGSPGLFANFGQGNCIHTTPCLGPLAAGAAMSCRGRITFGATSMAGVCAGTPVIP